MTEWLGHERQEATFIEALGSARMPHAWLLAGPQGIGKAAFAQRAARFLIDDGDRKASIGAHSLDASLDEGVRRLIASGAHPEFLTLKREPAKARRGDGGDGDASLARNITVDQVREIIGRMRVKPALSRWRTVIIDSIDDMERGAANALLKTLEEPPVNTVFFLVSHNPGRLLPTIVSRCRMLRFAPLGEVDMRTLLHRRMPEAADATIEGLLRIGQGSVGRALDYADLGLEETADTLMAILAGGDPDGRLRVQLAKTMAGTAQRRRFDVMLRQASVLAADAARMNGITGNAASDAHARILSLTRGAASGDDPAMVAFAVGTALASIDGASR